MKNTNLILIVLCLFLFSCDEVATTSDEQSNTSTVNAQVTTPVKPEAKGPDAKVVKPEQLEKEGQVVAFSSFNTKVQQASSEEWVKSPFQVALKFGGDQMFARKKVISAESLSGGETFDKLLVTIEEEGLLDDSIKGSMLILRLEQKGELWLVNKATRVWKCWPNRGHVEYNSEPCS